LPPETTIVGLGGLAFGGTQLPYVLQFGEKRALVRFAGVKFETSIAN
jgi:hypothetical protein